MSGKICHHMIALRFCVVALLSTLASYSQTPKGLKPVEQQTFSKGKTRAIVIGISNYQYIDKLLFADKDAEVFAEYLAQTPFWNIAKSDIVLLTNEKAKRGDLIAELQRLAILSKAGDNLIFYFSGHGDTETFTNKGYLLTYDTYSNNYMAGALSVNDLKDIFGTLTTNNVQVVVITDACRAGNLAGGKKGVEYTGIALKAMWHNEIKILSSQPNQESVEGKQWGNGRGIFSYYLVNGLKGAADEDKDSLITLDELRQYFRITVVKETDKSQQPFVWALNEYSTVIASLKSIPDRTRSKSPGNAILFPKFRVTADSCSIYYQQLEAAITEKKFDRGDPNSATSRYRKIRSCTNDSDFILGANSRLLSALMNTAQEIVNNTFIGKNFVKEKEYGYAIDLYDQVLENNDLRLPYDQKLTNLKRYLTVLSNILWGNYKMLPTLERILDSAIREEPDAAYLLSAKGILELRNLNYTNAIGVLEKATSKSPGWLIPKYYLGVAYGEKKNYRKALDYYHEVMDKDSSYKTFDCAKCIFERMAAYEKRLKKLRYDKYPDDIKEKALNDSIRQTLYDNMDSASFYHAMGMKYDKKNHPKQDSVYFLLTQAVLLDPEEPEYLYSLLRYMRKKVYGEAEVREWLKRNHDFSDDDKRWFQEELMYSYLYAKDQDNAFRVAVKLFDDGLYKCSEMKKLNKKLGKLPAYISFLSENCAD